jgi:low affinity Fe/Cu permease
MQRRKPAKFGRALEWFARKATDWSGTSWAFLLALVVIVVWAVTGPVFGFSDTWQLVINTGTTVVTFLMVFLIQRSQNKDGQAIQLKLNELIAAVNGASARMLNIEDLSEAELRRLHDRYRHLAQKLAGEPCLDSHTVEEELKGRLRKETAAALSRPADNHTSPNSHSPQP